VKVLNLSIKIFPEIHLLLKVVALDSELLQHQIALGY